MKDSTQETIGDRIKMLRKGLGMSQLELARRANLKQPTISSLEMNQASNSRALPSIAHALHVDALWLQTGEGPRRSEESLSGKRAPAIVVRGAVAKGSMPTVYPVEVLESRGSCGGGNSGQRDVDEMATARAIYVLSSDLQAAGIEDANAVKAVIADGDGMADFFIHGDVVLFDTTDNAKLRPSAIYAFQTATGPVIKRVIIRANGRVILSSDNPDKQRYPDEDYSHEEATELDAIGRFFLLSRRG